MSDMACAGLMASLSGLLLVLSWVGWRYFVAPASPPEASAPAVPEPRRQSAARARALRWRDLQYWSATSALLAGALVGGVFLISGSIALDPLTALQMHRQTHIQAALNPERLAPPPSLPPSLFVGSERPALDSADRDWSKLDQRFTQAVLHVVARLAERGYGFVLIEGYRSPERQDKLAELGSHVTTARAYQSRHQHGLAANLAPLRDGRLLLSERDPWAMTAYRALGEEAERSGLIWGGRWTFRDFGHVEAPAGKTAGTHAERGDSRADNASGSR